MVLGASLFNHLIILSCRASRTDIPDPLSPPLPIVYRFRQVFWATPRILTELLYVAASWAPCLCSATWRGHNMVRIKGKWSNPQYLGVIATEKRGFRSFSTTVGQLIYYIIIIFYSLYYTVMISIIYYNILLLVLISEMKLDNCYCLEYSGHWFHLNIYAHNVWADMTFGLLQVFHVKLGSPHRILNLYRSLLTDSEQSTSVDQIKVSVRDCAWCPKVDMKHMKKAEDPIGRLIILYNYHLLYHNIFIIYYRAQMAEAVEYTDCIFAERYVPQLVSWIWN